MTQNISERCPCGAKVSVPVAAASALLASYEIVKDWRENHKHEERRGMEEEPLAVVESSSSHEVALPFGFTAEPFGVR